MLLMAALLGACSQAAGAALNPEQHRAAVVAGLSEAVAAALVERPLYSMKPAEVEQYLRFLRILEPDLRKRVAHLARKNIGQPYEIFLLGEFPYELHDPQPLFSLEKSDCVVFVEHTYAMALSGSWAEFFWMLQRMRYRDGIIGLTTRNHYTDADWNPANAWLVSDITRELGGQTLKSYRQLIDRAKFFGERTGARHDVAPQTYDDHYIPRDALADVLPRLREGDFVNVVSARGDDTMVSHVGLVVLAPDGSPRLIHSAAPKVREESFESFIAAAKARDAAPSKSPRLRLLGFRFLRLNENPEPTPMRPQPRPPG